MSKHVSYRGFTIDMESMSRENEKVTAIGNMGVNGKGDKIKGGAVTRTADQIARDNHRVQSMIVNTGLKGAPPPAAELVLDIPKSVKAPKSVAPVRETELPNGDIVAGDSDGK